MDHLPARRGRVAPWPQDRPRTGRGATGSQGRRGRVGRGISAPVPARTARAGKSTTGSARTSDRSATAARNATMMSRVWVGGANEDRTHDLLHAIHENGLSPDIPQVACRIMKSPNFADGSRVFFSKRRLRSPERSTVDGLGREAVSSWPGSDVLQRCRQTFDARRPDQCFAQMGSDAGEGRIIR